MYQIHAWCVLLLRCVWIHTAMLKKPVVTEVRTPTNTWSGLGFSKSMPAETIKELRRANHVSYKPSMTTTYEVRHVMFDEIIFVLMYTRWIPSPEWTFALNLYLPFPRVPRCPCLAPAAGRALATAVTRTTGERGTALATVCRVTRNSPLLSAAPRGSRTNLVSSSYFSVLSLLRRQKSSALFRPHLLCLHWRKTQLKDTVTKLLRQRLTTFFFFHF